MNLPAHVALAPLVFPGSDELGVKVDFSCKRVGNVFVVHAGPIILSK